MELLSVAHSKDQGREQQHEDDASTTNLLAPPRPQLQSFHSHDYQPSHSHRSQPPRLWQIFWCLLTIVLSAFILGTVKIYQSQGNFDSAQKHIFNTITTALILALGLNFFEAFKSLAKGYKWKILEQAYYTRQERELVSNIENLTDVLVLGWKSLLKPDRKLWTALLCIAWIGINILAQVSVAMISLTYSVVDGTSWNDTYTRPGIARASNLKCFAFGPKGGCVEGNQARAHAYGDMAIAFSCGAYDDTSQILTSRQNFRYYCRRTPHQQEFAYRFNEYNFNDTQQAYPRFTQRIITASAGQCFNYTMVGDPRYLPDGNVLYEYSNGTFNSSIKIPGQSGAWDGTTYIYRGSEPPEGAELYACGPRCLWMWAHKSSGHGEPSTFYQCPITVSPVSNTSNDTQRISDGMARLAAASIATQGRPINANVSREYQFYAFGSHWEVHFKTPDQVGANMAEFAIGSISTMASTYPWIQVDGLVPYLGSHVEVKWYYFIPLVAGINGAHLALFLLNLYAT